MAASKLPEVDLKKWGDRIIQQPAAIDEALAAETDEQPVGIIVSANEMAKFYADKSSPRTYAQYLLERLKDAGCPAVSGSAVFRLRRGKVFKLRSEPGNTDFKYIWLPPALVEAVGMQGDDKESVRLN